VGFKSSRSGWRSRTGLLGAAAVITCAAAGLALPGGAHARVEGAFLSPGPAGTALKLDGSDSADTAVTVRRVAGVADPTKFFYEVEDPGGVANVPPGCFRRDATAIHCPVELVDFLVVDLFGGDDVFRNETTLPGIVVGGDGVDFLDGGGDDTLNGGPGNDKLLGQAGNDMLIGGPGNDKANGGPGKDIINCGSGKHDVGIGGPGKDLGRGCETVKH
jgi:hypothetical protein